MDKSTVDNYTDNAAPWIYPLDSPRINPFGTLRMHPDPDVKHWMNDCMSYMSYVYSDQATLQMETQDPLDVPMHVVFCLAYAHPHSWTCLLASAINMINHC